MKIKIDDIGPSLNKWYVGLHWTKRKKEADKWHLLVKKAVGRKKAELEFPVSLHFHFNFGKGRRTYDVSNCAATVKLIEDGLCKAGVLPDDTAKYVNEITMTVEKKSTGPTFTEVEVRSST